MIMMPTVLFMAAFPMNNVSVVDGITWIAVIVFYILFV
jgi:hypothetical protein